MAFRTMSRLPALDWMRGIVMVLMALDHASMFYNAGKLPKFDSWVFYDPALLLEATQFFIRWVPHLCAPTFLFLAGTALALGIEKRRAVGATERDLDRYLLTRGLVILGLELTKFNPFLLQVLYAIGMSLICMIPLRRLNTRTLLVLALGFMACSEALYILSMPLSGLEPNALRAALGVGSIIPDASDAALQLEPLGWFAATMPFIASGIIGKVGPMPITMLYPFVPWLVIMMLGCVFGRYLVRKQQSSASTVDAEWLLLACGLAALAVFVVIRGLNGYGNMFLIRTDGSLTQWLNVSKYPPSLSFFVLELGLMAVCLAGLFRLQRMMKGPPRPRNPVLVFGQTALFFYMLHIPLMFSGGILARSLLGLSTRLSPPGVYLVMLADLAVMYPLCLWFRRYKAARPTGWARYF